MSNNRNHFIGARFTKEEKEYIINMAKKRNSSVSELIRESIFSHLNFLEKHKGKMEKLELVLINRSEKDFNKEIKLNSE